MINQKDIDAYKSITAPDSLKAGLVEEHQKNNSRISSKVRMCYSLAAVLVVIVVVFAFLPIGRPELLYDGTPINKEASLLQADNSNARIASQAMTELTQIPLQIKTERTVTVTVSHGVIEIPKTTQAAQSITLTGDTDIIWTVALADNNEMYTLKLGRASYSISQNSNSEWILLKNN